MNYRIQELCDENIQSRSDFRKWAKDNHPDKVGQSKASKFVKINNLVQTFLPNNESSIDCDDDPNRVDMKQPSHTNIDIVKANCIRSVENWTKIQRHHRFDKQSFDKEQFKKDMITMSPKMVELLKNIRELDNNDYNNEGKYYKHFIFSDVKKGGYGAKIIASSLVAHGFNHCFSKNLKVGFPPINDRYETFGLLSSTSIYDKSFTQNHIKQVLNIYNDRPSNTHGENMRFIVLDSGFKEGIDLYDVKYVHIFENQRNTADLIQAVGRATRSCGQKGLNFLPNVGWKLHVYQYYLTYEDMTKTVFDDYLRYAGVDLNNIAFLEMLEKLAIETAVDYDLNIEINKFENKVDDQILELPQSILEIPYHIIGGERYLGCTNNSKCGSRSTKTVPFPIKLFKTVYNKKLPTTFHKMIAKDKRKFFCEELKNNKDFCVAVNKAYSDKIHKKVNKKTQTEQHNYEMMPFQNIKELNINEQENRLDMKEDMKNTEDMTFEEFQKYINQIFKEYKYKPIKVENHCEMNNNDRIVKFTESQNFVTRYFVPEHFAKGLLVWHSVGTGKTCTAISVKSFLYENLNYSIIWVTRNTLKEDIWKNMYDKICDHVIRQKMKDGVEQNNLRKYLSKRFLPPMSYKQFSNMLEGKNDLYQRLVKQNGTDDILKNTLVIIDEAHKLYSKDLVALEKPNMESIENKINASRTCKVLLMTGTPIADDPMEFIKLMNLIMKKDKLPIDVKIFREEFMKNNNFSKSGKKEFQSRTKGLISYLNRRFDPRQFAQPVFHKKPVQISTFKEENNETCLKNAQNKFDNCMSNTSKPNDAKLNNINNEINHIKDELKILKDQLKADKKNVNLKGLIALKTDNLKYLKISLKEEKQNMKKSSSQFKSKEKECKKDLTKNKKKCKENTKKQENNYQDIMLQKC